MSLYRTITSGKNQRREYFALNKSPLFQALPDRDFAQEQKKSYSEFLYEALLKLLNFYFPAEFSDYNNKIKIKIEEVECNEPEIKEHEARSGSHTWNHAVSFYWVVTWDFYKKEINLQSSDLKKSITQWVEQSFKIGKFTCKKKSFLPKELKNLLTQTKNQLKEAQKHSEEKAYKNIIWRLTNRARLLEQNAYQTWEIVESKKKPKKKEAQKDSEKKKQLKIVLEILEQEQDKASVSFCYNSTDKITFCHLPKMNEQGNFIINGHEKVVVFQSVRAPSVYFFAREEKKFYSEIIPFKGPWISVSYSEKKSRSIELKFLNSKSIFDLLAIFKTFSVPPELLEKLFSKEELNIDDYQSAKPLEIGEKNGLPKFLFTNKNSYFDVGKLGRKKFNRKLSIIQKLSGQTLAEDLRDCNGKLVLKKNTILEAENLQILQKALKTMNSVSIPHATNELYIIKIKSPQEKKSNINVIGIGEELSEEKTYFDLADLICIVSSYMNLYHSLGTIEKEEEKDKLENQIIRRAGNLVYNILDNKFGSFLQDIDGQYLAQISHRLKKVDLTKIPGLNDFDNLIKHFFNTSALVQLQNQNNPLSEISYTRKLSVLGLGGFSSANTTLAARNINSSYYGRYDLVETPEGQRVGLIHNLTINSEINSYGQVVACYYPVRDGVIFPESVYLASEEGWDKYMVHASISVNEKNEILEEKVMARYRGELVWISKEKIDYIDSSFYQLNSITSSTIPFFQHNDATRMLMATNMQRQAVTLLKSEEPLIASGIEAALLKNSPLTIKAEKGGIVEYVDSQKIIVKEDSKKEKTYELKQLIASNKNILNFSQPLVKKGEKIAKGQMIACGNYANKGELSLGHNLRVAYLCWNGYNYEDAIILNERLIKEDILTSFFVKKHTIIRRNTKYGPEIFTASFPHAEKKQFPYLDKEGIVKVGSSVEGNDILVGKLTPEPSPHKETEEELLLMSILGERAQRFVNTSLRLSAAERGIVYDVKRKKLTANKNELELVEVYVAQKRKIEVGDKLTTRFGNKGVVAKIVREADMPFDENGDTIDIIFNPLSIPSRMNVGQLLETVLAAAARKLKTGLLVRPFNTPKPEVIKKIIKEAKIENFGAQKLFNGQTGLPFQQDVYNGYIYTIKLNHMATDKFHARNTGPYSLIYQQPLKGRAQEGGQRVGEMEAWVLEAHGAPYNLMEMMSAKSDDIRKRRLMQNSLLFDDRQIDLRSSQSESLNLLLQYLRGIGFDLKAVDYQGKEIDFYESFSQKTRKK